MLKTALVQLRKPLLKTDSGGLVQECETRLRNNNVVGCQDFAKDLLGFLSTKYHAQNRHEVLFPDPPQNR